MDLCVCALTFALLFHLSLQDCPEEVSNKGIKVIWPSSSIAENVTSSPLCYKYEQLITRNCNGTDWEPSLDQLDSCLQIVNHFDSLKCPPGHYPISEQSDYCYQINTPSDWNYPCYKTGRTTVITDLNGKEITSLITALNATEDKYYWLPAQRTKLFNPIVWYIPGPNWGRLVTTNSDHNMLEMRTSMIKNCLLLDVEQKTILTEACSAKYPSLCFSVNEFRYPCNCPDGYYEYRFMPDDTTCYGIEESDDETGLTYDEFVQTKCPTPSPSLSQGDNALMRYTFTKVASLNALNKTKWCWFQTFPYNSTNYLKDDKNSNNTLIQHVTTRTLQGIINESGTLSLTDALDKYPCMACEVEMNFKQTEFIFEYDDIENKMYLTIYYPSGLWKNDDNDTGVQCFSNAKGFVNVVDFSDDPVFQVDMLRQVDDLDDLDKIVYKIDPVTYRAAQYWCEGHTKNFSLLTTNKLVVNPNCNEEHVFAIVLKKYKVSVYDVIEPDMSNLISNVTDIFNANKVLVMDILDFSMEHMLLLLHLHVAISDIHNDKASNIQETYFMLKEKAELELPKYNYTFVNISSSFFCLPTISEDVFKLHWEMTPIGHIAAPQQFCLQVNGLPVKRHCYGSYLLGGSWGDVEGTCDSNYEPSWTTKFLFDFVKGNIPDNDTTHFITNGLGAVLGNINNFIPADIYYLSMSLKHVLYLAKNNKSVDMGDIDNVAWVMDRIMLLDHGYLRLSQTLNSTNVILDSVNDIIEHLVEEETANERSYFLAVKPQFIVQVSYPKLSNITGIAIVKNTHSDDFTDMVIQPLFKNTSLSDVLALENLEVATWLSDQILDSLTFLSNDTLETTRNENELHIVLSIFYSDAVFQEVDDNSHEINSRVIGISIPGYTTNLKHAIPLVFKEFKDADKSVKFCGYWNFLTENSMSVPGSWTNKGCFPYKSSNNITVCECFHLTHFGQLLNVGGNKINENQEIQKRHKKVLNIITLVGCFLSLSGIIGIWITASVFSAWRQKAGTKVLLHLSSAIALPLIFIIVFNVDNTIFTVDKGVYKVAEHMEVVCIVLGALLHYSILASFMWMLITAALQFVRYVRVLGVCRPSRFMMKCTAVGWGVPFIPIIVILLLNKNNYIPDSTKTEFGRGLICYPKGFILIMSVILPVCIILVINVILFVVVMYSIYRGPDGKMRATDIDLIGAQFRLSIFLFFLLGLTWIFGILSLTNSLLWSYLFCLTSTLQGFVLFVYFIVCDPNTRNMWITLMTPNFRVVAKPRESITSISSG